MELLLYWRILRKRLWLIVMIMVLAGSGAVYYVRQQVPLYSTSTTLFLNSGVASPLLPYQTVASVSSLADTYVEFMRTHSFASLLAQEMEYPLSEGEILGAISSRLVPDTQFFKISATHPDPYVAQALANTAAEMLIAENISRQQAEQQQIDAQQNPARDLEGQRLAELLQVLQDELTYYNDRIAALQDEIADLESRPPAEDIDQRILDLREDLIRNQSLRVDLFGSLAQTQATLANFSDTTSGFYINTAIVVDPAPLPTAPQSNQMVRTVLVALVAGLGLGIGLAYLLEYLDYTIKTPEELDVIYGISTLGVIGTMKDLNNGKVSPKQVITLTEPRSPMAEAFRALRTNIRFASTDEPVRSLLITSAGPSEGKTMTSANLAVILAQGGSRVLLVDADLRRPRIHRVFDVAREPGLTDLVLDRTGAKQKEHSDGIEAYLQPTQVENLRILACGPLPPNPAELLSSNRAAEVMEQLKGYADIVVYDTPPAATVTDAVVLGARVDAVLQVVMAGGPRRDVVLRAKNILEKVGARILGPVLNQVSYADLGYYSYYYYYGYYHDGHDLEKQSWLRRTLGRRKGQDEEEENNGPTWQETHSRADRDSATP